MRRYRFLALRIQKEKTGVPLKSAFVLAGLSAVYVSSDETAQIHERVTAYIGQRYIDCLPLFCCSQLLAGDACGCFATRGLPTISGRSPIALEQSPPDPVACNGVTVGLTGGMGVETLGYKILHRETGSLWYKREVTVEEFMEMFVRVLCSSQDCDLACANLSCRLDANVCRWRPPNCKPSKPTKPLTHRSATY